MLHQELTRKFPTAEPARNVAQRGDALELLHALSEVCAALGFFDPQHRDVLDQMAFGNEAARQRGRGKLPAMSRDYIDDCCREFARVLRPGGYLMLWVDTFKLCEAHHLRIADVLKCVDLIAWDNLRPGMGKRSRRRGDYLLVLQKPVKRGGRWVTPASTWRDHSIPNRWRENIDRTVYTHPHAKPIGLIRRLIKCVSSPGDLVVDPAAGSFVVMHAALARGRNFVGCDLAWSAHRTGAPR